MGTHLSRGCWLSVDERGGFFGDLRQRSLINEVANDDEPIASEGPQLIGSELHAWSTLAMSPTT